MQFKKLRRSDRKKNNQKEDSGFVMKLLAAPKHPVFTSETCAQCVLCIAQDSLAGGVSRHCPVLGSGLLPPRKSKLLSVSAVTVPA